MYQILNHSRLIGGEAIVQDLVRWINTVHPEPTHTVTILLVNTNNFPNALRDTSNRVRAGWQRETKNYLIECAVSPFVNMTSATQEAYLAWSVIAGIQSYINWLSDVSFNSVQANILYRAYERVIGATF